MQVDYYKLLGLSREATFEQIRKAYRVKAKLYHPDINSSPNAKILFQLVNEAYQILIDPEKKRWYDFKLKYPTTTGFKHDPARRRTSAYSSYNRAYERRQEKQEDNEFRKYKKTLLDNFLFYFLVMAGILAVVFSVLSFLSEDESQRSVSGLVFGIWFLFLLFYGWNLMNKK